MKSTRRSKRGSQRSVANVIDEPRNVAVLIDSFSSANLNRNGFSCAGCGGYNEVYIVGTLNSAQRLMVWCDECFAGNNGDDEKFHSLSRDLHVPKMVLDDIMEECSNEPLTVTKINIQSKMSNVEGCLNGCMDCASINSLLSNVWLTEIDPWYGEDDDVTVPLEDHPGEEKRDTDGREVD